MRGLCSLILLLLVAAESVSEVPTVRAKLEKTTAWTGEPVPLVITLYSPGPFSGTAAFDLPELPRTAIVQGSNPVVGNETIDDKSYFTQRHEFSVYTQQTGELVLPPFRVRFAGKKTFTSDPEPMEGHTPQLRFQSKRPPGTESMGVVISAREMQTRQTWNPDSDESLHAGDVLQRTIRRDADGTTAMMLPPLTRDAPAGVRVYIGDPVVQDNIERGEAHAHRSDLLKYQFQRPGSYLLPAIDVVWWDPQTEELQRNTLPGKTLQILPAAQTPTSTQLDARTDTTSWWRTGLWTLLGLTVVVRLCWKPVHLWIAQRRERRNQPEVLAVRQLRNACASNDALVAYTALSTWLSIARTKSRFDSLEESQSLQDEWQSLSRYLFGTDSTSTRWDGAPLWTAFTAFQNQPTRRANPRRHAELPELNPSGVLGRSSP